MALQAVALAQYRRLRRSGLPSQFALHYATRAPFPGAYNDEADGTVHLQLDRAPEFSIVVTAEPDPDPDDSWLGYFTQTRVSDATEVRQNAGRYFVPCYTISQRRKDLSARGYSRGVASELAEREARADARAAELLDHRVLKVSVRKADIELAATSISVTFGPAAAYPDDLIEVVVDYTDVVDEVIAEARAALPRVIRALCD
ncbi:hypothetical protein GCM10022247_34770 [Allokutzneria multivorans]|uniref:Uncharacterized protein n=1 Tax=Allokutzneria multivorans TaxID=1142134 RepID=A0ABP7SCE9_9PSEU